MEVNIESSPNMFTKREGGKEKDEGRTLEWEGVNAQFNIEESRGVCT